MTGTTITPSPPRAHSISRDELESLQLVVTELLANALLHGRGVIRLDVQLSLTATRGHVLDDGGGFSYRVAEVDPMAASGRGLRIVDALTTTWGVAHACSLVWFEIDGSAWSRGVPACVAIERKSASTVRRPASTRTTPSSRATS